MEVLQVRLWLRVTLREGSLGGKLQENRTLLLSVDTAVKFSRIVFGAKTVEGII